MKKRLLIGAIALTTVLSLVGCGKKDPQELINEANANLEKYASVSMDVVGDAGVKIAMEGMTMDLGANFDISVLSNTDVNNLGTFIDGKVGVTVPGTSEEVEFQSYMVKEGDVYRTYAGYEDMWTYTDTDISDFEVDDEMKEKLEKACEGKGTYTLRDKTEKINDKECYVIDYELTAAEMLSVVEALDEENSLEESEEVTSLLEKIKKSEAKTGVTIYISKKDVLPVKYEVNVDDFITSMVDIALGFLEEQEVDMSELKGMNLDEIKFDLTITVTGMSNDEVTVPGDVKLAATATDLGYDFE